MRYTNNGYLRT